VITLARAENDELVLRPINDSGHVLAEQRLGIQVTGAFAARWDLVHRQILIVPQFAEWRHRRAPRAFWHR
jgi:hypothetical protein